MRVKFRNNGITFLVAFVMLVSLVVVAPFSVAKAAENDVVTATASMTNVNIIASGAFDNGITGDELQPDTTAWGVNTVVSGEEAYSGYSLKVSATDAAGGTMFNYGAGNVMAGKIKANTPIDCHI